MPARHQPVTEHYDLYPSFPLGSGQIELGYDALAARIRDQKTIVIDGYGGVFWANLRSALSERLRPAHSIRWFNVNEMLRPEAAINDLLAPFLGGDDPIFGKRFM